MSNRVSRIDRVVIRSANVPAMIAFYCDVLGCAKEREVEGLGLVQLRTGASLIDIVDAVGELGCMGGPPPGEDARNMDHFCMRVDSWDEGAIRAHLLVNDVDAGPTKKRYGAEGAGPSIYLSDPDGNAVGLKGPSDKE
ncbi:MAG: VOC family protein [Rhodospirillaceae bacterium]